MKRQGAAFPASIVSRCSVEHTARPPQSRGVHDLYFGNHGGRCARHLFGFCTSAMPGWLCIWPCAHSRSSMECAYYTCPHHRCHWEPDDGIMMRTAKGHTGRPPTVGQLEVLAFLLVQVAAVVRVFGGLLMPSQYMITVVVSAFCWAGAFALYAAPYWPLLSRPRWTENQDKARFRSLHQDARASAERRRGPKPSHRYTCS